MRINKFVAQATGMSRRMADQAIEQGKISINGQKASLGDSVQPESNVSMDGKMLVLNSAKTTIMLNKPAGYVCSRNGQGSKTIYDLLPEDFHHLKPVGRLDKESSGLLLLTNDGDLAHKLTHPSFHKKKVYEIKLDKTLNQRDLEQITKKGVELNDGPSKFELTQLNKNSNGNEWLATLYEGRNRQIRRTFNSLSCSVKRLHRITFGNYQLSNLSSSDYKIYSQE